MIEKCIVCGEECKNDYPQYEQSDYITGKITENDRMEIDYVIHYKCIHWMVYRYIAYSRMIH